MPTQLLRELGGCHYIETEMTKENEHYAYITVVGDFDPETISARIGLQPGEAWRKGDRNERSHLERQFSQWSLDSRLERSASLEYHVKDVLEQALPRADQFRLVGGEYEVGVQLVGYFYNDYPGFGIDQVSISELARLNVGIDCDFYTSIPMPEKIHSSCKTVLSATSRRAPCRRSAHTIKDVIIMSWARGLGRGSLGCESKALSAAFLTRGRLMSCPPLSFSAHPASPRRLCTRMSEYAEHDFQSRSTRRSGPALKPEHNRNKQLFSTLLGSSTATLAQSRTFRICQHKHRRPLLIFSTTSPAESRRVLPTSGRR